MKAEQIEKAEKWIRENHKDYGGGYIMHNFFRKISVAVWQACLDANGIGDDYAIQRKAEHLGIDLPTRITTEPSGYFRIGEKVEYRRKGRDEWLPGTVKIGQRYVTDDSDDYEVRRPVWEPKEGEAVLFCNRSVTGLAEVGVFSNEKIFSGERDYLFVPELAKPFDAAKIGKPWREI